MRHPCMLDCMCSYRIQNGKLYMIVHLMQQLSGLSWVWDLGQWCLYMCLFVFVSVQQAIGNSQ